MTDSELKRAVEDALHHEVRLRGRDIAVAVHDGRVTLQGQVSELAEKRLAVNLVRRLREVGEIKDVLRLPTLREFGDNQIQQHVEDALMQDPNIHESQLKVAAQDGVVTLTGQVNSLEEMRLAGLCAWWIPGVADVDNQIVVEPHQEGTQGDLVDIIRIALDKDVLVNSDTIGVSAKNNVVHLLGSVNSEEERLAAEHDVYYIWGVEEVINDLVVSPR